MINLNKDEQAQYDKVMGRISLSKDKETLGEHVVNLSKCMVDLGKKSQVDLCNQTARVVVALDYSGSMTRLYRDGTIQDTLNRLAPLGLSFDDNGALEVYLFQNTYHRLPEMTLSNYANYMKEVILTSGYTMGGTQYAPVVQAILADTGKLGETKTGFFTNIFGCSRNTIEPRKTGERVFVIFITDGENSDASTMDAVIRASSESDIFIQFIGIGSEHFNYLRKLDDLSGRRIDNTGFTQLTDLSAVTDAELYTNVLSEFAGWLKII